MNLQTLTEAHGQVLQAQGTAEAPGGHCPRRHYLPGPHLYHRVQANIALTLRMAMTKAAVRKMTMFSEEMEEQRMPIEAREQV